MKPLRKAFRASPTLCTLAALVSLTPLSAPAATNYVWQDSPSPGPPYATWATAAHTIQDAVDAAGPGDTILVTNSVYAPIFVTKPITILSINGPAATIIDGGGTNSCACLYLDSSAILSGFTLTN